MGEITSNDLIIDGDLYSDAAVLEKFSRDASSYRILPKLVAEPKHEEDIVKILQFARNRGLSMVCRGGGSGLSGAGVGDGIILNFKKYFNRVVSVGEETVVQPGTILDAFIRQMSEQNLMLPSVPSSSALCTLGGNVGTRSTGPRSARYGTIDTFVSSLRFVTARGEIVDTRDSLPAYLAEGIRRIRDRFMADPESRATVEKRPYIAGGYNLKALSSDSDEKDVVTHLLVGSIGTLGIITEIRLRLIPRRPSLGTFLAYFRDFDEFAEAANRLKALDPAALEFADANCSRQVDGHLLNLSDPSIVQTMMVEFDESTEQASRGRSIIESCDISGIKEIMAGSDDETALWEDRRRILPSLWKYARKRQWLLPSIIDDIAIHLENFGPVVKDLNVLMEDLGHEMAIFGHLGFGSIHARPFFDPQKSGLVEQILRVSRESFKALQRNNGTLVGEHNSGRSRSIYLEDDLGPAYRYLRDIKGLFDADDILNPGTIIDTAPIYVNMNLDGS
jgi:FAD/FMN-containing dehydrogenase